MTAKSYARSIELPTESIFRNLKHARRFAIDIGGSLAKLSYCSTVSRRTSMVFDEPEQDDASHIYNISETDQVIVRLHFVKFETKYIETCLDFIQGNLIQSKDFMKDKYIKATGGGAYKYKDLITSKLGVQVDKEDEMDCLICGCNFLLKNIPDESFVYQRHGNPDYKFQGVSTDIFPYLLVNIGSGVSLIKVESENKFERIGGTSTGGGTFWGLGSLLTEARSFDELVELAERGDHRSVDMLVKDIYGGAYTSIGLPGDIIASSFGKAARSPKDKNTKSFKEEDLARSLLLSISNDIGQIAYLHARIHNLKKIYFGGYFIRGHPMTMHTITFAINYWSKGEIQALFLRHEGYLGAIGAFLKGEEEEDTERYSWGEHFAGSSGLVSPKQKCFDIAKSRSSMFDHLEIDRLERPLLPCTLLLDVNSYYPDTVDLTKDAEAREYWLQCFSQGADKSKLQAIKSQPSSPDAVERADKFKSRYLDRLSVLKANPCCFGSLNVRTLLDTSSQFLSELDFTDPFSQQKQFENEQALKSLDGHLNHLDTLSWDDRQMALAKGLLAGNVFDWGAMEVRKIMETQEFGFADAQDKLQAIFCDNSGADIILGVIPLTRELLSRGTSVILCANSRPTLNDVTFSELQLITKHVAAISGEINQALTEGRLLVMESGQGSPCLDLRLIDQCLVDTIKTMDTDLIIIEGMGRAIHTNFEAAFSCECLKVAVIKNRWLANRFGGDMFNVMFKYERSRRVSASNNTS
ncbi:4'-phosphopantetheine phosphatase-like isoform X2 [Haliotis cracherodii]|uniref:4'-phosphopantetheine phosphatase-like isoform X2 n=1 Tax=Haliotis cracherodii TaxID=6455 RepID=UPI0039EA5EF4